MASKQIPRELTVIPLFEGVIVPWMKSKIGVGEELGKSLAEAITNDVPFALTLTSKEKADPQPNPKGFYTVGSLVQLESIQEADNGYLVHLKSVKRIRVENLRLDGSFLRSGYTFFPLNLDLDESGRRSVMEFVRKTLTDISHNFHGADSFLKLILELQTLEQVIGFTMPFMQGSVARLQEILETESEKLLGIQFIDLLLEHKNSVEFQIEMARNFHEKVNKSQREALLREQMKAIQQELGKNGSDKKGRKDYRQLIEEAMMPDDIKVVAMEQVDKLDTFGTDHYESAGVQNYLDLLVALPWKPGVYKDLDIAEARKILDEDHYGIEKVKTRIIQHLAVMKLKKNKKGSILLFVGPPGTGKTSLGKSIARAMGRSYQRLSLGGIRDEAEIRGHRRTYIGALPGRIIQGMKKAKEKNPVFVLDEVDKLMVGYSGDPASALLEVLDPEQNNTFTDHYLEAPYDLSEVFFIATANTTATIPAPLLDRMEVIELTGYTLREKMQIATKHIIPVVIEDAGLTSLQVNIEESALNALIAGYTREAGVRGLKKELASVVRAVSEKVISSDAPKPFVVDEAAIREILGKPKVRLDDILKSNAPGVVTGLAWTPVGGDILFVEASVMPGRGELILTGQLGDVMKESARISMSLIESRLAYLVPQFKFTRNNIHIHVPAGAIPKDGPSAGITLFTSLASLLTNKRVDPTLAMTGEITLRGSVLPVGGIKEKVLAAQRAGIKRIILSRENEEDLKEIPKEVSETLEFILVDTIEDVVRSALKIELPEPMLWNDGKAGHRSMTDR
jgi:ATP-dependent Lon protease